MTSEEYEKLTSEIAKLYCECFERLAPIEVKHGRKNRLKGVSGYEHQIDISVRCPGNLILIECKRWKSSVTVEKALAFLGRVNDIRPTFDGCGRPEIVTTIGLQRGAEKVAKHYGIEWQQVRSAGEYIYGNEKQGLAASSKEFFLEGA